MNIDWAREKITSYLGAVRRYDAELERSHRADGYSFPRPEYEKALSLEIAAKAVMERIRPGLEEFVLVNMGGASDAIDSCIRALAILDQRAEIEENVGDAGPQLSAGTLHPWVWEVARSLWETRHYREAVQVAATSINAHLQDRSGRRELSDYKLTTELFSAKDPEPGKPRLRWPGDPAEENAKSMQSGLLGYGAGIFQCIRNPATHGLDELSESEALERLAAMSLLCHWIEQCKLVTAEKT
ncbi:TIGR02391 family protein [Flindersiella endophytica]